MGSTNVLQHSILNELYLEAAADLLAHQGTKADLVCGPANEFSIGDRPFYVSVLCATSNGIVLSSVLKVDRDLLTRLYPVDAADISRPDLEDWCRELNNQLVGRMKNKLARYGVTIALGLPLLLTGTAVSTVATPDLTVTEHTFRSGDGLVTLTLATLVSPDVELHELEASTGCDTPMLETAVVLF